VHDELAREVIAGAGRDFAAAGGIRYIALRDGVIAGGARLRMAEGVAQLAGATTAPAHRRRGVQAALLSARLADAAAAGCDIAVVTTLPDPSLSRTCSARASTCFYSRHFGEASLSPQGPALACRDAKLFMRQAGLFGLAGGEVCYPRAGHPG
jgi:GNAT superfamily N-acetyltransferase